jgi:hypothetical protein
MDRIRSDAMAFVRVASSLIGAMGAPDYRGKDPTMKSLSKLTLAATLVAMTLATAWTISSDVRTIAAGLTTGNPIIFARSSGGGRGT